MRTAIAGFLGLTILFAGLACTRTARPAGAGLAPNDSEGFSARLAAAAPAASAQEDRTAEALRHYVRGRMLMVTKEHARAADELAQAVALVPDTHRILLYLGLARYDAGDAAGAVAALDQALRLKPDDPATLYFRGRIAAAQREFQPSVEVFTHLIRVAEESSPFRILGLYYLARVQQELGNADGAVQNYEALLESLREPQPFFRTYTELFLLYRSRVQLQETLGRLYLASGSDEKAVRIFEEALADRPDHTETIDLLCRAYLNRKNVEAARRWARKWIADRPDDAAAYQCLAKIYEAEGNPGGLIEELETARRTAPLNAVLAFQLAAAYEGAGRRNDAETLYRTLADPADPVQAARAAAALKLADLCLQDNRPVDALEVLASAMTARQTDSSILVRAAKVIDALTDPQRVFEESQRLVADSNPNYGPFVLVAMLAERLQRRDEALALYGKALARRPAIPIAASRKADLLIEAGRYQEALAVYQAAIKAGLNLPIFHRRIGMLLEHLGRLDEALAEYRLVCRVAPDDKPARYLLVGVLARLQRFDEAEKELKDLLLLFPGDAQTYARLAAVCLARGDLEAAEKAADQARAADAEAVTPDALLAEIRYRQKRFPEAEQAARHVLGSHPELGDVRILLAYALAGQKRLKDAAAEIELALAADPENVAWRYLLAGLYMEMGDVPTAERQLQQILRNQPDYAPAKNDLGYLWADRGVNLAQAEKIIREALQAEPQSPAYLDSLGWVMYKRGCFEDALKALQDATGRAPKGVDAGAPDLDPTLWDHLGDTYWRLSRRDEAAKAWQAAEKIIESRGRDAKPGDLQRVQSKVRSARASRTPQIAPLAPPPTVADQSPSPDSTAKP